MPESCLAREVIEAPPAPTRRECVKKSEGVACWIKAKVEANASSRDVANSRTRGGGTSLIMWPKRFTPQTWRRRRMAKGSSVAISSHGVALG
jgi:hypothetical protein